MFTLADLDEILTYPLTSADLYENFDLSNLFTYLANTRANVCTFEKKKSRANVCYRKAQTYAFFSYSRANVLRPFQLTTNTVEINGFEAK